MPFYPRVLVYQDLTPPPDPTALPPIQKHPLTRRPHPLKPKPRVQLPRPPIRNQTHIPRLRHVLIHPPPELRHDHLPQPPALMRRIHRDVRHLEETAAVADYATHAYDGVFGGGGGGGGGEDLDGEEGVAEAGGCGCGGEGAEVADAAEVGVGREGGGGVVGGVGGHWGGGLGGWEGRFCSGRVWCSVGGYGEFGEHFRP